MKIFGIHFFGKPKSEEKITKYLLIFPLRKARHNNEVLGNALVCYQFDNKEELEKYIKNEISKSEQKEIETYKLLKR